MASVATKCEVCSNVLAPLDWFRHCVCNVREAMRDGIEDYKAKGGKMEGDWVVGFLGEKMKSGNPPYYNLLKDLVLECVRYDEWCEKHKSSMTFAEWNKMPPLRDEEEDESEDEEKEDEGDDEEKENEAFENPPICCGVGQRGGCDKPCDKKYIGNEKGDDWGETNEFARHPYHWNQCGDCFKKESGEDESEDESEDEGEWECEGCGAVGGAHEGGEKCVCVEEEDEGEWECFKCGAIGHDEVKECEIRTEEEAVCDYCHLYAKYEDWCGIFRSSMKFEEWVKMPPLRDESDDESDDEE